MTPVRTLAAEDEPRRAAAADQRAARRHVARRAAAVHPLRDRALRAAPLRALPRAAGHHRPLAGDGAGARHVRRGARHGRRLRARLVARARPRAAVRARRFTFFDERAPHERAVAGGRSRFAWRWSGSATGARTSPATCRSSPAPSSPCVCDLREERSSAIGARYPERSDARRASRTSSPTTASRRSRSRRRSSTHFALALAALEAGKHVFVEKPLAASSREAVELIARRGRARPCADAGPHVPLQPARQPDPRPDPGRRARRDLLHLDEPRQPRPAPARRQRRLGSRPARLLDPPLLAGRDPDHASARSAAAASSRASRTSRSSTSSTPRARSRTSSSRGSRRASFGARRSSAPSKMVVYDDTSTEPVRIFDSGVSLPDPETFGEYQLTYRTGDIVSPRVDAAEPLALELADFCHVDQARRDTALLGAARARGRAHDRGRRRVARRRAELASS